MKHYFKLWSSLCVLLFFNFCAKDYKTDKIELENEIAQIKARLKNEEDLKIFADYLDYFAIPSQGSSLTIFAVKDLTISTKGNLSNKDFSRHIIPQFEDLDNIESNVLLSINADSLFVAKVDGLIYLNGVKVSKTIRCSRSIIYVVDDIIPEQSFFDNQTLTVLKVQECNINFSPIDTVKYHIVNNAIVQVYEKQNNRYIPKYNLSSNSDGIVSFSHENRDLYYTISTPTASCFSDGYQIIGMYTSQSEMLLPVPLEGTTIGSLKYKDINKDNIINELDKTAYCKLECNFNEACTLDVYIAPLKYESDSEILANSRLLQAEYRDDFQLFANLVQLVDYQLTDVDEIVRSNTYGNLINNQSIHKLWDIGYKLIEYKYRTAKLMELASPWLLLRMEDNIQKQLINEALVYNTLYNYFGVFIYDMNKHNRTSQITNLIDEYENNLTFSDTNKIIVNALLARLYLQKGNYREAIRCAENVISSGHYQLASSSEGQENVIIGGYEHLDKARNSNNKITLLSYEEVLLIASESYYYTGNYFKGTDYTNQVLKNKRLPLIQADDFETLKGKIYEQEVTVTGMNFATVKRWNYFLPMYSMYGAEAHNKLLPLPLSAIAGGLKQNPGY